MQRTCCLCTWRVPGQPLLNCRTITCYCATGRPAAGSQRSIGLLPHLSQVKIVNADNGVIVQRSDFVTVRSVSLSVQRPR